MSIRIERSEEGDGILPMVEVPEMKVELSPAKRAALEKAWAGLKKKRERDRQEKEDLLRKANEAVVVVNNELPTEETQLGEDLSRNRHGTIILGFGMLGVAIFLSVLNWRRSNKKDSFVTPQSHN